ncbi:MAG: FAD-binding protein [Caldilinea sp. CFX5]|nr:FAD-binding protein [Caldilinea sp. CFX5]
MPSRRDFLRAGTLLAGSASLLGVLPTQAQSIFLPLITHDAPSKSETELETEAEELPEEAETLDSAAAQADVTIVIGAGIAGLAAARLLVDRGRRVIILEGRNRIGGRIWSERSWPNAPLDLGASWIHGVRGNPLTALADALKLPRKATDFENSASYAADGRALTDKQVQTFVDNFDAVYEAMETIREERDADGLPDIPLKNVFEQILTQRRDSATMQRALRWYINTTIEHEYAADSSDLSLYYWDDQNESLPGGDVVFPQGYDQIFTNLVKGLEIRLGQIVQNIAYGSSGVTVTTNQGQVTGTRAIITLPLGVLKRGSVTFTPALPAAKVSAINRLNMGVLNKTYLRFSRVFWDQEAEWLDYIGERTGEWAEWLNIFYYTKQPVLLGFNAGAYGAQIESLSDEAIVAGAMTTLRTIYGSSIPNPEAWQITRWGSDPFAYGSYSHVPAGATSADRTTLAKPVGNRLYFAGEATHRQYPSTVHGAFMSGQRAAQQILG